MFSFIIVGIVMVSFQSKKKKKKSKTEVGTRGWGISVIFLTMHLFTGMRTLKL